MSSKSCNLQQKPTAVILAGGGSRRIGRNKAFLKLEGKPVIQHQIETLKTLCKRVIIIANKTEEYRKLNVTTFKDEIPYLGPLGGIYTGLKNALTDWIFVCGCDMPFIDTKLIEYEWKKRDNVDIVVPFYKERFQTLHALYKKSCLKTIEEAIRKGERRIRDILPHLKLNIIKEEEIVSIKAEKSLVNINTTQELKTYNIGF
ncbi:MAG: molybdenum cofactor guanylyltransferase [Deltaproteobacteria bacterium]|nr:molybdenum cofactor guanylyltransferase [Deltaproteobacteria bacterium]